MFVPGTLPVLGVLEAQKIANAWFNSKERRELHERNKELTKRIGIVNVGSYSADNRDRGEDYR